MEIIWTEHVRNEEILQRIKENRYFLQTIKRRKANRICRILRRNCLLKEVVKGKLAERIGVMGR